MKLVLVCLLIAVFKHLLGCCTPQDKFKGICFWEDDGSQK
jgi:hypothetical protein